MQCLFRFVGFRDSDGDTDNDSDDNDCSWLVRNTRIARVEEGGWRGRLPRTDDDQGIPLPPPRVAGAGDCVVQLGVGLLHVAVCLLGTLVDLLHCGFLLVDQLGNLLVELSELDHVLFDLADCGGSLDGSLASIVGLAGSSTGDLL